MNAVPVALSLTASFMSAITVLGTPVEVYQYGAVFILICIAYVLMVAVSSEIFLPIFYRLGITSTLAGRSEGSGVDRCIPGGHHFGWALGSYRPISAAAGRDLYYHQ